MQGMAAGLSKHEYMKNKGLGCLVAFLADCSTVYFPQVIMHHH